MGLFSKLFGTPTREDFARSVIDALRADGAADDVVYEPATFSLRIGDGVTARILHLGNVHAHFLREERQARDEFLRGMVRRYRMSEQSVPKSFRDAQQRLLPSVRSLCFFSFSNLAARANGLELNHRPFRLLTESIGIGLVLDDVEMMRGVDHALLAAWGVGEDEALRVALDNLRARTEPQFQQQQPGLWVSGWRDGYDATRILFPEMIAALPVRGRHVVVIPHPHLLAVTGEDDPAGLTALIRLAASAFEHPRPIATTPLVRNGDAWEELRLDDAHPAASALALIRLKMTTRDYDEQQELLAAEALRRDDDTFIAPFIGTRDRQTGAYTSYCPWTQGVRQSLPRADRIAFLGPTGTPIGFVPWADALRVMHASMKPTQDYPPRYAVDGDPTEDELREMGMPARPAAQVAPPHGT